jgi:hypothetical protein
MAKTKISEFSATAADNTDITNINIAEGCSPANVNNAIRSLMSVLKNQQDGSSGDPFTVAGTLVASGQAVSSGTLNVTGAFQLDSTAGASGQALVSAGGSNTPTWSTLGTMAAQNSTTVAITGGTITGITDLAVADGGTGASTITANSVILGNGASALSGNLVAPSTSGNVLTSNGTTWTSTALNKLTSDTAQTSTSGTSIDFTGIPSWVKRITVMFSGVSLSASAIPIIQIGTSGGIQATGYTAAAGVTVSTTNVGVTAQTIGFPIAHNGDNTFIFSGSSILSLLDSSTGIWVSSSVFCLSGGATAIEYCAGTKTLSGTLDRVRITSTSADTFDAGKINILYE